MASGYAAYDISLDPRTLTELAALPGSTLPEVYAAVAAAYTAAAPMSSSSGAERAGWLEALATAVEAAVEDLVAVADAETGLGVARLTGEVTRCANQLRFYAGIAREGSFLGATIDSRTATTPDLRRIRRPLGPVAVFGASNFPFGFGTLGNDTGSALAAGCPVVVKGHPAHPQTHAMLADIARTALAAAGAPDGAFGAVTGFEAGQALVLHPQITAVAFTGSQHAGLALWSLAASRPVVIPVFAEMGTVNPVVVTPAAADSRLTEIAEGCVGSFTLGMGQFCTKPGLLLAPLGSGLATHLAEALLAVSPRGPLLTPGIAANYVAGIDRLVLGGAVVIGGVVDPGPGTAVSAAVLAAAPESIQPGSPLLAECFGPVVIVVEYPDTAERDRLLATLDGCLVAAVMTGGDDDPDAADLVGQLAGLAGRVVVDEWTTGVATTWAQHHGGPWPSTSSPASTSVGAAALDRFSRPVTYQNTPQSALPAALRDGNPWRIPRRVDGRIQPAEPEE